MPAPVVDDRTSADAKDVSLRRVICVSWVEGPLIIRSIEDHACRLILAVSQRDDSLALV